MIPLTSDYALEVVNLKKAFGGLTVTHNVSLAIKPGERRLIIGPNGAGKTTLFNQISGDLRPNAGAIRLFGTDITFFTPYKRAHFGLSRTYQIITLFFGDTLEHNVTLGLLGLRPSRWQMWRPLSHYCDLATEALGLGFQLGVVVFGALIAVIAFAYYLGANPVLTFWLAYILTRPLGASLGDLLSQSRNYGGAGLGTIYTSIAFLTVIVALVTWVTFEDERTGKADPVR